MRIRAFVSTWLPLLALVVGAVFEARCSPPDPRAKLLPTSLPDLARADSAVQAQVRERYEALTRKIADRSTPAADLASAHGEYGMVLHAAAYFEAAEPCYVNGESLSPDDIRWPYYLAHLYNRKGMTAQATAAFTRVLAHRPDDF